MADGLAYFNGYKFLIICLKSFQYFAAPRYGYNFWRIRGEISGVEGYVRCHAEINGLYSRAALKCGGKHSLLYLLVLL